MAVTGSAAEEARRASRDASSYFDRFDKSLLYHANAIRDTEWLLAGQEKGGVEGTPCRLMEGLGPPDEEGRYTFLVPHSSQRSLHSVELQQLTRELVEGIYVFNQIPQISFEPNYDSSTSCFIPSAYHDSLVGEVLFTVDYFVKSLLHGTTVPRKDQRCKLTEVWKKVPLSGVQAHFTEFGLEKMEEDEELGRDLYTEKKVPFIRYPEKNVDNELANKELSPRLTTGEDYSQQRSHLRRDVFLRFLDHVSFSLVFRQKCIQQKGAFFLLQPTYDVTSGVIGSGNESGENTELYPHLHTYLQRQRAFVAENLCKKPSIAHSLELLGFISFMIPFLITLRQQNKTVCVSELGERISKDLLRTERELPPVLPSVASRWSPFTARNSVSSFHGGISFHRLNQHVQLADLDTVMIHEAVCSPLQGSRDLPIYKHGDKSYHIFSLSVESYYCKSPKLPRWLHAMVGEFKTQCARLPSLSDTRIQELLRKHYGPIKAATMNTVNVSMQASVTTGLLPAVTALLKRCTKTSLHKVDENGKALVHHAALNCRADALSALLWAGCNANQPLCTADGLHPTSTLPIHLAAMSGGLDAVCCLLHFGANLLAPDDCGWVPVHYAAFHNYQAIVTHLVSSTEQCIDVETGDKAKATPLLLAARSGGFDTVQRLVALGANISATDRAGKNVVHFAVLGHHINIIKYLIELNHYDLDVWGTLSEMLSADPGSGFPEAAARSLDSLTQWRPNLCDHLLQHNAVSSLVKLLKEEEYLQKMAVQVMRNLSNINSIKDTLIRAGAIQPLVHLLASASDQLHACTCIVLSDLSLTEDNQTLIAKSGAIPHLVKLLASRDSDVQLYACACLGTISHNNPENQTAVATAFGIPALISLLSSPLFCIQSSAASSLQAILEGNRANQLYALSNNSIPSLVVLLRSKEVAVCMNAARAVEALAENCAESQSELLGNSACIHLLKRLLKMRDPRVKVCGGCALWAIAGCLISNKRLIATHMGLELLVDMITIHNEKLDFVCSEALGSLATELGDNQNRIATVGGVKPLVEVLTTRLQTSQRVTLSVIHTLAALVMKPALVPNSELQRAIATSRGISALSSIVSSSLEEITRVEAACTLAKVVLNNSENDKYLTKNTTFSFMSIFQFLSSNDPMVRLLAGYCLAIRAFNNPAKLELMKAHGSLDISIFNPFLQSENELFQVYAAFQIVVLSRLLIGVRDVEATVLGVRMLVSLCSSKNEQTKVLSAEFLACLAHSYGGIPNTIVMAGAMESLLANLRTGNGPVIESSCVALGYLTFNSTASRMMIGAFRDNPELYSTFKEYIGLVVVGKKFLEKWSGAERDGLPALSLEVKGGPSVHDGRRASPRHLTKGKPSLSGPSTATVFTDTHSTAMPDTVPTEPLSVSKAIQTSVSWAVDQPQHCNYTTTVGPLTRRKLSLPSAGHPGSPESKTTV